MRDPMRVSAFTLSLSISVLVASCGDSTSSHPPPASGSGASAPSPLVVSRDERAQVPAFLWADPALKGLAASQGLTAADAAARAQLLSYAPLYRMNANDVASLALRDVHDTGRGAIVARFARQVDGVEVFNEVISVAMDRQLDAVALTGFVTGDLPAMHKLQRGFSIPTERATASALGDALDSVVGAAQVSAPRASEGGYVLVATSMTAEPVRTKKVWFRAA